MEYSLMKNNLMKNDVIKLDGIDKKILQMLMENSRRPILEIAKNIGISGAAIHQRLRKLEKNNLIIGSSIKVNTKILGYTTMAFIGIFLDRATNNKTVVNQLKEIKKTSVSLVPRSVRCQSLFLPSQITGWRTPHRQIAWSLPALLRAAAVLALSQATCPPGPYQLRAARGVFARSTSSSRPGVRA